jgi:hypothetical protein
MYHPNIQTIKSESKLASKISEKQKHVMNPYCYPSPGETPKSPRFNHQQHVQTAQPDGKKMILRGK